MDHRPPINTEAGTVYLLPIQVQQATSSGATLASVWEDIASRWRLLLVLACLGAAAGIAASFLLPRIYRSEALLAVVNDASPAGSLGAGLSQLTGLADMAGIRLGGDNRRSEAIATLASRSLTEDFIRDKELMQVLFADRWDASSGAWKPSMFGKDPTLFDAVRLFDESIREVAEDRKSGLVTLRIEWKDREQAANWANALVHRLNSKLQAQAIAESRASLDYLAREATNTNILSLRDAAFRLTEQELKRIMLASVRDEYALRIVDPAIPSDENSYIKPNRRMMAAVAALLAVSCGGLLAVLLARKRRGSISLPT